MASHRGPQGDRAVEQGFQAGTILLDQWYTGTDEGNVSRGSCRDAQRNAKSFGIDVDAVWKPSQSTT